MDLISGLGRSLGEGNGNPLRYSCLENLTDIGAWRATLGGAEGIFFFPERWGECVMVNNMFPIICLLKTQGNLRMWLKQPGQRASGPSFLHCVRLLELNKHLLTE